MAGCRSHERARIRRLRLRVKPWQRSVARFAFYQFLFFRQWGGSGIMFMNEASRSLVICRSSSPRTARMSGHIRISSTWITSGTPRWWLACHRTIFRRPGSCGAILCIAGMYTDKNGYAWWLEAFPSDPQGRRCGAPRPFSRFCRLLGDSGWQPDRGNRPLGAGPGHRVPGFGAE